MKNESNNELNNELLEIDDTLEEKILDKDGIVASINSCAKNIEKVAKMIKNRKGVDALKKTLNECKKIKELNTSGLDEPLKKLKKLEKSDPDTFNYVYKAFNENVFDPIYSSIENLKEYYELASEFVEKYTNVISEATKLGSGIKNVTSESAEIKNKYKEIEGVIAALTSD